MLMRARTCVGASVALVGALALGACGDDSGDGSTEKGLAALTSDAGAAEDGGSSRAEALIGTWTFHGETPEIVDLAVTLRADKTFTFVEHVSPISVPATSIAGPRDASCVTTDTYVGTYAEQGANQLTWTFTGGTANVVSGCDDASHDSAGTSMTDDAIASYREQGYIPAASVTYTATPTTLVITPGLGPLASAMFERAP
jgi:hypothetical protein